MFLGYCSTYEGFIEGYTFMVSDKINLIQEIKSYVTTYLVCTKVPSFIHNIVFITHYLFTLVAN